MKEHSTGRLGTAPRRAALATLAGLVALATAGVGASAGSAAASCNVSIGILSAFTGDLATPYGLNGANAASYAYSVWHKQNPKCKVTFVRYDTQGNPPAAINLARTIAGDQKIVAVLGPTLSIEVQAAMPVLNAGGVPAISSDATNPTLSQQGWTYFHRTPVDNSAEGPAEARYLVTDLHAKRIAVLDDTETYGKGIADIVAAALDKLGAQVVDRESLSATANDYSSTINRIKGANADGIFYGGIDPTGAPFIKQLRDSGSTIPFLAGSGLLTSRYLSVGGSEAEGSYVGSVGINATQSAVGRTWLAGWKKLFHKGTDLYSVEWYNATTAFLNAIGHGAVTRSAINAYIGSHSFTGATGNTVAFQANGNVKRGNLYVYKDVNGAFQFVATRKTG